MIPKFRAYIKKSKKIYPVNDLTLNGIDDEPVGINDCGDSTCTTCLDWYRFEDIELMQSTGIKDKNGVEIFEGDIVILTSKSINYADTYWHNYAEVFKQPNGAYRLRGKGIYETELYSSRKQVTVVGNIYQAPELLEKVRFWTETENPELLEETE